MNVKRVGTESCVLDRVHCTLLAKAAGIFAHVRTTHSACPTMDHVFVHQVTEVTTAVMFVLKEHLVKIAHSDVSARMEHSVPLKQDDASANQVGLDNSAIDHAMNTSMGAIVHSSASAGTMLDVNHRMVLVFVHQDMRVNSVMIGVNKAHMVKAVSRNVTVIKATQLVVIL